MGAPGTPAASPCGRGLVGPPFTTGTPPALRSGQSLWAPRLRQKHLRSPTSGWALTGSEGSEGGSSGDGSPRPGQSHWGNHEASLSVPGPPAFQQSCSGWWGWGRRQAWPGSSIELTRALNLSSCPLYPQAAQPQPQRGEKRAQQATPKAANTKGGRGPSHAVWEQRGPGLQDARPHTHKANSMSSSFSCAFFRGTVPDGGPGGPSAEGLERLGKRSATLARSSRNLSNSRGTRRRLGVGSKSGGRQGGGGKGWGCYLHW